MHGLGRLVGYLERKEFRGLGRLVGYLERKEFKNFQR